MQPQVRELHQTAGWVAADAGVEYLDIGPLALRRPDATLAHYASSRSGVADEVRWPTEKMRM